ncbi:MAG: NAD(P)H-quinone oxidoreductase [Rickettsiales bacterium]|nr:NAD(P)H-quinone oxidoreductase [Rickettsiales bacterium]
MQAINFDEPGGPEVLKLTQTITPKIKKDEVLIKVKSAGVNRPDVIQRQGNYPAPPGHSKILGLEVSGIIEKVGNDVNNFLVGDKVGALVNGGGYAEFCKAHESSVFHIPKNISFNEAACIPECFFTAWSNLVMRGKLKKKQKILIHGGTSGVGIASIQIAKLFESYIMTTVGNEKKVSFCEKLGVDKILNYKKSDFFEEIKNSKISSVDLILDFIGGDYIKKNINLLNNDGKLLNIGFQNGSIAEINFIKIMLKRLTITGSTLRIRDNDFKGKVLKDLTKFIFPQIETGKIKIYIDSIYKLDDVVKAHKRLDEGKHIGKIVLNI